MRDIRYSAGVHRDDATTAGAGKRVLLADALAARTAPGVLGELLGDGAIRCTACAHRCVLEDGRTGACGVRHNAGGELRVPFGYVARRYVRAVETNTVYHVHPGARALTFGMFGCDLRCPYCHNWRVSQALREGVADEAPQDIGAAALVDEAVAAGCRVICSAYNEPMITAEWAHAVFTEARARGLTTALISDGNTTAEALRYLRPVTDVFRVDVKAGAAEHYRALGGRLEPVLAGLREARRLGYWIETVTLVAPGLNDDLEQLRVIASEILAVGRDIPWHVNAFHPRYLWRDRPRTASAILVSAAGMALARGLRHVYVGNVAGEAAALAHTRCPGCGDVLVRRQNYATVAVAESFTGGVCRRCETRVAGIWDATSGCKADM